MTAVKAQIRVRKNILQQKADPSLFAFSSHQKPYTLDNLKANLFTLMDCGKTDTTLLTTCIMDPSVVVGRRISHAWSTDNGIEWYEGTVLQMTGEQVKEYEVKYDNSSEESVYLEIDELLADLKNGDLKLL